jgi:hypothetical protein
MANNTTWPPDTICWEEVMYDWPLHSLDDAKDTCGKEGLANVTTGMIDFLNLTSFDNYFQAYCELRLRPSHVSDLLTRPPGNNPTQNDSCPFNVCPNVCTLSTLISLVLSRFIVRCRRHPYSYLQSVLRLSRIH